MQSTWVLENKKPQQEQMLGCCIVGAGSFSMVELLTSLSRHSSGDVSRRRCISRPSKHPKIRRFFLGVYMFGV